MIRSLAYTACALTTGLLVACGGGGGDSTSQGAIPVITIRPNPMPDGVTQLNPPSDGNRWANLAATAYSIPGQAYALGLVNLYEYLDNFEIFTVGSYVGTTVFCSGGGTVRMDYSKAKSSDISVGDYISLVYTNCLESGTTLTGTMRASITGFDLNTNSFAATYTATGLGISNTSLNYAYTAINGSIVHVLTSGGGSAFSATSFSGTYASSPQSDGRENGSYTINSLAETTAAGSGQRAFAMDAVGGGMTLKADVMTGNLINSTRTLGQVRVLRSGYGSTVRVSIISPNSVYVAVDVIGGTASNVPVAAGMF